MQFCTLVFPPNPGKLGRQNEMGEGRKTHDRELRLMADLMFSQEMAIGDIAQKLCKLEWHDYDDIDSLEKTLQRWKDKYETGLKD